MTTKKSMPFLWDRWVLSLAVVLVGFGLLMVASSSMVISDQHYGYPFHYLWRQLIFLGLGVVLAVMMTRLPSAYWQRYALPLMGVGLLLLLFVLLPGIGHRVNGSRRWLGFAGLSFQVSEAVKLFAIVYLASYIHRFHAQIQADWVGFLKPLLLLGMMALLLLAEPDFGSVVVITLVFLALLFLSGARLWPFAVLLLLVVVLLGALAVFSPYRLARLTTFLNPWHTAYGAGYQLTQSLIAFGRGGVVGVGLGNSVQKLFYLPEAHTDFIFAVISEELGVVGAAGLLALYALLVGRIMMIAKRALQQECLFSAYFCYGVGLWISTQVLINIGVCAGILPTKGLTLPLMSYGGSSLLMYCLALGMVLRIAYETSTVGHHHFRMAAT